jgi:hypothetical protein
MMSPWRKIEKSMGLLSDRSLLGVGQFGDRLARAEP